MDLHMLKTHKPPTLIDIISGNMGKNNFTGLFNLLIGSLLLLLFNQVIKD